VRRCNKARVKGLNTVNSELILASGSPRRRELLGKIGAVFRVVSADIDEDIPEPNPAKMVETLALLKARAVLQLEPQAVVIAADTTVAIDDQILNKPRDGQENVAFIERLNGRWHDVYTGVCIAQRDREVVGVEHTRVKFRALTPFEIQGYAHSGEGLDKAGGYGIQEMGMALVERIEGDFFNVVGLPINRLLILARELGLPLLPWVRA
jgi:septum formation protein